MLAEQLRDVTSRINSLVDEVGDDQMTIPVSPSTPTSGSLNQRQKQTKVASLSKEEKNHGQQNQNKYPEQYNQPPQRQRDLGPPPPPPAHWSSLALRQAMRRQQQINHRKKLLQLQQQQQQQLMQQKQDMQQQQVSRIPGTKLTSMKRRNNPANSKKAKQRAAGRRPRANHVSPNLLGMPPSLRLGPAR